jgi:hypothetical protein
MNDTFRIVPSQAPTMASACCAVCFRVDTVPYRPVSLNAMLSLFPIGWRRFQWRLPPRPLPDPMHVRPDADWAKIAADCTGRVVHEEIRCPKCPNPTNKQGEPDDMAVMVEGQIGGGE